MDVTITLEYIFMYNEYLKVAVDKEKNGLYTISQCITSFILHTYELTYGVLFAGLKIQLDSYI